MNLIIFLLMLSVAISDIFSFLGIVTGLVICFLGFDGGNYKNSSIVQHLTTWSWWDIRV